MDKAILVALLGLLAAVVLHVFKLQLDRKIRRNNQILLIKIYCEESIERWENFPDNEDNPDIGLVNFNKRVDEYADITKESGSLFTPFVSSANSNSTAYRTMNLRREDIYGLFEGQELSHEKLKVLLKFIHDEQLANALADDLRSEYVRKELSQDRKAEIFRFYGTAVNSAYRNAIKVRELFKDD